MPLLLGGGQEDPGGGPAAAGAAPVLPDPSQGHRGRLPVVGPTSFLLAHGRVPGGPGRMASSICSAGVQWPSVPTEPLCSRLPKFCVTPLHFSFKIYFYSDVCDMRVLLYSI